MFHWVPIQMLRPQDLKCSDSGVEVFLVGRGQVQPGAVPCSIGDAQEPPSPWKVGLEVLAGAALQVLPFTSCFSRRRPRRVSQGLRRGQNCECSLAEADLEGEPGRPASHGQIRPFCLGSVGPWEQKKPS